MGIANYSGMSNPTILVKNSVPSIGARPRPTMVSLFAAQAGRNVVWALIASAFLIVEALVFLTELPATKFFPRREAAKVTGHGRR
jgi:hypothetical protein